VVVLLAVIGPLQRWRAVEPVTDRRAIRIDVLYTLIHRLGVFRLAMFFTLEPLFDEAIGSLRTAGFGTFHLDEVWPGVTDVPWVAFAIYLVVLDFVGYWIHRGQHQFNWWWSLHSLHHSQRQMTMWSDDRNHLLDDILQASFFAAVALVIGVEPSQFVVLVAITNLMQSVQHANIRLHYGWLGERLLVSPAFHRRHHAIGYGHEGTRYGCNFGVLLPWWDMLFRTASWNREPEPTGIRDQIGAPGVAAVNYGDGFFQQHWLAFRRIGARLASSRARNRADSDTDAAAV